MLYCVELAQALAIHSRVAHPIQPNLIQSVYDHANRAQLTNMRPIDSYKLAFDITPMPMLLVSGAGKVMLANQLLADLFAYDIEELIDRDVEMLVPAQQRHGHSSLRDGYFVTPSKRRMGLGRELYGQTKSGSIVPLELALENVMVDGQACAIVIAIDIRERLQYEQYLKVVMNASASAMLMADHGGQLVFLNQAAESLFGYAREELLGLQINKLVPDDVQGDHVSMRDKFLSSSASRAMDTDASFVAQHKNGLRISVDIAVTTVDTPNGKMTVFTMVDLTERVKAHADLTLKSAELTAANEMLQQFAYSASHDLKAPLSTIVGLLAICIEDLEEGRVDDVKVNLQRTLGTSIRSSKKVEHVLQIARMGQTLVEPEFIDLQSMLDDIWQDLTGADAGNIAFRSDLQHDELIYMDRGALHVILENLLSNAIRYSDDSKAQKYIEVRSDLNGNILEISVTDNGIGIPSQRQDQVFDMFKRIDSRSENGLGLSLVKAQVERLGGEVRFKSEEGVGTEFVISVSMLK